MINTILREYLYTSHSGTQPLAFGDMVRVATDYLLPGGSVDASEAVAGRIVRYMGTGAVINLTVADYSDYELWKLLNEDNVVPSSIATAAIRGLGLDAGKGRSYYGLITRNEVSGGAESSIYNTALTAGGRRNRDSYWGRGHCGPRSLCRPGQQ